MKVDSLHNLSYKEEFAGDTKRSTTAYKKVRENAGIGATYIADTSKVGSQISDEPAQRIKIREHRQIPKFNVPNLEVSKVYKLPLEGGYARSLIKPVIMAGGNGKRLWPLSSKDKPKQLKKILSDLTLLQQTLNRNKFLGQPTIITSKKYESITKEQAAEIDVEIALITEPLQKNTTVCAIITALSAKAQGFDIVVLLPSDHHIADDINYLNTINKALHYVNEFGICTIGIPINVISAEYGYINTGLSIAENVYLVDHFIEKPILEQANKHFQSNEYFWNSGICVYDVNFFLNLAMNLQPNLFCIAEKAFNTAVKNENSLAIDNKAYNEIAAIAIDNAIMEYISGMVMIKADFAWNDLGIWHSLLQVKHRNINDNYCEGNVVTSNTTNSFISSNNKLTTVVGLNNVIIIDTMKGLLVADQSK